MIELPTILWVGTSKEREEAVRQLLRDTTMVRIEPAPLRAPGAATPRLALVDLVGDVTGGLKAIDELVRALPAVPVIALAASKEPELILEAMRAGAREFVVPSEPLELERVVTELLRRQQSEATSGRIVAVFASKGGVGATTLATNLAGELVQDGKRVVLVDLDVQLGDVLVFLDAASRYTIADVLHNQKRLDRDLLLGSLTRHPSGVYLLAQSDHLEDADKISAAQVGPLLQFLARHFEYVVCDGLRGFDELALAALDAAQKILLVATQDVPSVKNAQRCLEVMRRLGYGDDKVNLVVNRHQKSEIDLQSIADNLGAPVHAAVSNDYPLVIRAINRGVLLRELAPRARVVEDLGQLGHLVSGTPAARERRGFLRGLFGRNGETPHPAPEPEQMGDGHGQPQRAPKAV